MTVSLKHTFQSAKADGADTTVVQPSDWNDEHQLTLASGRLLGRTTAGDGAAEEISVGSGLSLSAGVLSATGGGGGGYTYSPLSYTYTGTLTIPPVVTLTAPTPYEINGAIGTTSGKFVTNIYLPVANTGLTSIEFTDLVGATQITAIGAAVPLTSISFPALEVISAGITLQINSLQTLSFGALRLCLGNFSPSGMSSLTTVSVPALEVITGVMTLGTCSSLASLSFPSLTTVGGFFQPQSLTSLATISAPSLKYILNGLYANSCNALTTLNLPSIELIDPARSTAGSSVSFDSTTPLLANFSFGSTLKRVGGTVGNVSFTSCALNQASVDNILVRLAALDGTNGTTSFNNRTVTITGTSATPSATGLAAKATLVARGCTVTHR